ncbi:secoisolariciresinol dehydrogenase-like [Olea europaea subsp. europaea]|uniref:Secoisolariciresinol dehydrogenase-like n=1 Tax=Olea europaea subsp. europaea TaxID=158383 RepID=A0A8S0S3I0_OLEEU|nr:secoisolariciresinol dehydrogenase-like [Olea europaea subsp. europaea]CAA2985611.1 secoisolariciresinol dehydrogenase-like [Olea europaea subsp. europaea]
MYELRLEGKAALITGAATGIGESTARLFNKHGAKVLVADVNDDLGEKVCKELGQSSTSYVHCDVTKESDVETAVNTAVTKFGKLDIMHNNAGIGGLASPSILENEKSDFEKIISVNLIGAFLGSKHAARAMIPNRCGNIIMTGSTCSRLGGASSHAYTSSKHGVIGLAKNIAVELGKYGIRVNCVSPHLVPTRQSKDFYKLDDEGCRGIYSNLKGVFLKPEDVAEAALFLASDESKFISGHNLFVDGGASIVNPKFCMFE